jgi:hypothetical protein
MEKKELDIKNFFETLYSSSVPLEPNSILFEISFKDTNFTINDILHECFIYGVLTKYGNSPRNFKISDFNYIRDYIRSIGYEATLINYELEEDAETIKTFGVKYSIFN